MNVIDQIIQFCKTGDYPDTIYATEKDDLVILNYRDSVQYDNLWTPIEMACRGLIINRKTGEVVARPFDKFFNWNENGRTTDAAIKSITEKMDGSLGILYRDNGYKIATRGSFDSGQALWATEYLNMNHINIKNVPNRLTLLFEIIYPENRVVVDYNGKTGLYLLAARDRFTGEYESTESVEDIARYYGFPLPKSYHFNSISDIQKSCSEINGNNEGYVVEFENGQRFEFKGDEYKRIHKLICGLSFKFMVECHAEGSLKKAFDTMPDEFHYQMQEWVDNINERIENIKDLTEKRFAEASKGSRKELALWSIEHYPDFLPYMFAKLDGKDLIPLIYKKEFGYVMK